MFTSVYPVYQFRNIAVCNRYQPSFAVKKIVILSLHKFCFWLWKFNNGINASTLWLPGDKSAECLADGQDFATCQTHRKDRYESIEIVWGTQLRQPEIRVFFSQMVTIFPYDGRRFLQPRNAYKLRGRMSRASVRIWHRCQPDKLLDFCCIFSQWMNLEIASSKLSRRSLHNPTRNACEKKYAAYAFPHESLADLQPWLFQWDGSWMLLKLSKFEAQFLPKRIPIDQEVDLKWEVVSTSYIRCIVVSRMLSWFCKLLDLQMEAPLKTII